MFLLSLSLCLAGRTSADDMQAIREDGFHGAALHASTADPPRSSWETAVWNILKRWLHSCWFYFCSMQRSRLSVCLDIHVRLFTDWKTFPKSDFGCVSCLHWQILSPAHSVEVKSPFWLIQFFGYFAKFSLFSFFSPEWWSELPSQSLLVPFSLITSCVH